MPRRIEHRPPGGPPPRGRQVTPGAALLALLLLSFVLIAARVPFVIEPPGRDQSLFLTQADLLLEGKRLYVDVWEHKPPGVILGYALAMFLFGRAYASVQALDLIASILTGAGIWLLTRRLTGNNTVSVTAGALYLVFRGSFVFGGFWGTAQPETLMDPFVIGALLLLVGHPGERVRAVRGALAGVCVGVTILLKYSALPLLLLFWIGETADAGRGKRLARFGGYMAGAAIPWAGLFLHLLLSGCLAEFTKATIAFNTMHRKVSALSRLEFLSERVFGGPDLAVLHGLTVAAWLALWWVWRRRTSRTAGLLHGVRALLVVGTLLWLVRLSEVFWQAKFWLYQYQVILLPLCIGSAAGLVLIGTLAGRWLPRAVVVGTLAVLLATGLVPHAVSSARYVREHRLAARWGGGVDTEEFRRTYTWGKSDYDFAENARAAAAVARDTGPGDTIFVWGFEPGIYFLSGRRPAARFLYDYPLMPRFTGLHREYVDLLLKDLRRHPPRLILVLKGDRSNIETLDSWSQLPQVPRLARFVDDGYAPTWRIGDFHCFRRKPGRLDP